MKPYLLLILLVSLLGCTTILDHKEPSADPHVVVDPSLRGEILLQPVLIRFTPDGLMEIQLQGKNRTRYARNLQYRVDWTDRDNYTLSTILSRWNDLPVRGNETFTIKAIAPEDRAVNFVITIRKDPS